MEELELSSTAGVQKESARFVCLFVCYKVTHSPYSPAIGFIGIYPREMKTYVGAKICWQMFIAALFVIAEKLEKTQMSRMREWINKLRYVHTMGYSAARKRNKLLIRELDRDLRMLDAEEKQPDKRGHPV